MAFWKGQYGSCAGVLQALTNQDCEANWGILNRIAVIKKNGSVSTFNATSILLQATWTAAQAAADPDKLILTPEGKVFDYEIQPGQEIAETRPANGQKIMVRHDPSALIVTLASLTSANSDGLMMLNIAQRLQWYYITQAGEVIGTPAGKPFQSTFTAVAGRSIKSGQTDKQIVKIEHDPAATIDWMKFDCSSFILSI